MQAFFSAKEEKEKYTHLIIKNEKMKSELAEAMTNKSRTENILE